MNNSGRRLRSATHFWSRINLGLIWDWKNNLGLSNPRLCQIIPDKILSWVLRSTTGHLSFHIEHFQSASGFAFPNAHSGILSHSHFKALWKICPFTHVKPNAHSVKAQPSEKMLLHQFCLWVFFNYLLRLYVIKSRMRRRFNYLTKAAKA